MEITGRLTIICLLMYFGTTIQMHAETKEATWATPLHIEVSMGGSSPHKEILPFGTALDVNYRIKRFSIHTLLEGTYFLPKQNITKNYNQTANLGGGIGFEILPEDINNRSVFEVRASVTRSLGSSDYRKTDCKIGIYWLANPYRRSMTPTVGFGYCLRNFSNQDLHTYNGMYVSIGVRF